MYNSKTGICTVVRNGIQRPENQGLIESDQFLFTAVVVERGIVRKEILGCVEM